MKQIGRVNEYFILEITVPRLVLPFTKRVLNELESTNIAKVVHHLNKLSGNTDLLSRETEGLAFAWLILNVVFVLV